MVRHEEALQDDVLVGMLSLESPPRKHHVRCERKAVLTISPGYIESEPQMKRTLPLPTRSDVTGGFDR